MIADTERPTDEMLEKGFDSNDAGAGVAWRENGRVRWKKGILDIEEVKALVKDLTLPFVVHFRIPTEGGRRLQLCHPFPIENNVSLSLEGTTKGYVLFHNGHWSDWRKWALETAIGAKIGLPPGKWSDTRGMAFVASVYGLGVLEMINEKAVAFGPNDIEVTPGAGFTLNDGVWCSNMYWKNHRSYNTGDTMMGVNYQRRMCRQATCTCHNIDDTGYCKDHTQKKVDVPPVILNPVSVQKSKQASTGGDVDEIPFEEALELFSKNQISKKQFKKARRAYDKLLREGKIKPYRPNLSMVRVPSENTH
jgi:hypothetical protein